MDPTRLIKILGITTPLVGFYDAPEIKPFEPFAEPAHCIFSCYENWAREETIHMSKDKFSCSGTGYWLCGIESRLRDNYINCLVNSEGLKVSIEAMRLWLENQVPYRQENSHLMIGPLRDEQSCYLKTVTFFIASDQLSMLLTGAHYYSKHEEATPVIAPFFDLFFLINKGLYCN